MWLKWVHECGNRRVWGFVVTSRHTHAKRVASTADCAQRETWRKHVSQRFFTIFRPALVTDIQLRGEKNSHRGWLKENIDTLAVTTSTRARHTTAVHNFSMKQQEHGREEEQHHQRLYGLFRLKKSLEPWRHKNIDGSISLAVHGSWRNVCFWNGRKCLEHLVVVRNRQRNNWWRDEGVIIIDTHSHTCIRTAAT